METGIGGVKGPSPVRKGTEDPATGIESAKCSSPADFASSGMYAGTSKGGNPNWGDLEDDILEKDNEDPKEKSEDGNITSHIAEIYSYYNDKDERSDDQKDSDFPHVGVKLPKKDKEDPKEGDEDSGVTTDDDDDKPQNGNKSPGYDPDPAAWPASYDLLRKDYDKALQDRKLILNDKSLSEEVRNVHLLKSKILIDDMTREMLTRNAAHIPPDETSASSAAVSVSVPKDNTQATLSDEDEYLQCVARGKAIQERIAAREIAARTQSSSSEEGGRMKRLYDRVDSANILIDKLRAAKEKAASTQASSSNTDEDWTSLSATFDRAANKPGAFQGIANRLVKDSALEPPAVRRIVDVAADKDQWKEFLAGTDLQSANQASAAVRERNSSPKH